MNTLRTAVRMALPLVATNFMYCAIGAFDIFLAGCNGPANQAAVGIADQVLFVTVLLGTGLASATGCFVSQSIGGGHNDLARGYALDGLRLAFISGSIAAACCWLFAESIISFCRCAPDVKAAALPYLQLCSFGNLPFMIVLVQTAILRALVRTADCFKIWVLITLISIGGSAALFAFEDSPVRSSLAALALAWDLAAIAGALYGWYLLAPYTVRSLSLPSDSPVFFERLRNLCLVGVPVLLSEAAYIVSLFAMYDILGHLPASETLQAAYSVTLKIEEMFGVLPLVAVSSVSATLSGHQIGAGLTDRARSSGWQLAYFGVSLMLACGACVQWGGCSLGRLISGDASVSTLVGTGTMGATISLPLMAFALILFATLEGAGKSALPFAVQFAGYILCRIPLAFLLAVTLNMGFFGVWAAIFISRLLMAAAAALIFHHSDLRIVQPAVRVIA